MTHARTILSTLIVAGAFAVLSPPALAVAATPAATPAPTGSHIVTYETTTTVASTDPDGKTTTTDGIAGTVTVQCTGATCFITHGPYSYFDGEVPVALDGTPTSAPAGKSTSACDSSDPAGTLKVAITAAALTATFEAPAVGWQDCPKGKTYRYAMVITWISGPAAGDVCIFEKTHCAPPPARRSAAPVTAAAPVGGGAVSSSQLDTGSPAAPSVLSTLATPAQAVTAPIQLLFAALLTVILVLLVAFPTSLLNSAVESGLGRFEGWRADRTARQAPPADGDAPVPAIVRSGWRRSWWWAALGVAVAGVLSAFIDPQFGLNPGSVRMLLSILASFAIDVVLGWSLVIWLTRRLVPGASHSFVFKPVTLLVVVVAVVFTRITGFQPGIVFGLVAGVAFSALAGKKQEGRAALTGLGYAFVVAVVAWVAYGIVGGGAAAGASFWQTFTIETLASVAIGGMAALPIALFPLRGLPGAVVWGWSRGVWAACYAVGLFAFFIVLMPMPFSWEGVGWDLGAWIAVYLIYALGALGLWLALARPWHRDAAEESHEAAEQSVETAEQSHEPPVGDADSSSADMVEDAASVPADRLEG